ncbi:MAG TPA: hypothetical protein VLT89_04875 [Usitatibacter sp.]|nr:hypothetical protein [Usitatibacter sp.]
MAKIEFPKVRLHRDRAAVIAAAALALAATAHAARAEDGWRDFEGSWSASGSVYTLNLGGKRTTSIADLSGTLLLSGPSRPGVGFRGEALALSDTETGMVGRAVWTDENGDQVFSEIKGGGPTKGGKVSGTFVGGTGRYAGASGSYEFTWQYVMSTEDGTVQGRATGLKGRVRAESSIRADAAQGAKP